MFGCSASAVSQHIQKLKRQVKSGAGNGEGSASAARKAGGSGENDDEGEAPAKKRRTKAATPRKPRAPANKKGKAQEPEDMEAENLAAGVKRGRSEGDKAGTVEVKNKEAGMFALLLYEAYADHAT